VTREARSIRLLLCAVLFAGAFRARSANAEPALVDRAVVRFASRETGGIASPRFIFERQLAFEARLEALSEGQGRDGADAEPYRDRHVRAALERHIAETVLETQSIVPPPTEAVVAARMDQARLSLIERVGGLVPLTEAARAEGIADSEVSRLVRRQALASLYLDQMVAPMLNPTETELRSVHETQRTPFSGRPFADIEPGLRRWYVGGRLAAALEAFYDGLRTRLSVNVLH
jgi:hypothetical protein